jgi:hypothetical protein
MPKLDRALIDSDLSLLRVMAELWGGGLKARNPKDGVAEMTAWMLDAARVHAIVADLEPGPRAALEALRAAPEARIPLATYARKHGAVRPMGPARRDREQPWRNTPSPAEALWYRGLIAHAFFDTANGPDEFAYVPDDLLPLIPPWVEARRMASAGTPAPAPVRVSSAEPLLADDVTTLLAYAQIQPLQLKSGTLTTQLPAQVRRFLRAPAGIDLAFQLALELETLSGQPLKPAAPGARVYLELARPAQARRLAEAWRASAVWNDLLRLPGLLFEGQTWANDPLQTRAALLAWLARVPPETWWSLDSFVAAIKEEAPDFQRPGGDYDSWYVKDARSGEYLRGFEHWDEVEGALIRWTLNGPLAWFGFVETNERVFRVTAAGADFLAGRPGPEPAPPVVRVRLGNDGEIRVPQAADAYTRFRVARITKWQAVTADAFVYRLTPISLKRAVRQGVALERVIDFLRTIAPDGQLPPKLTAALERFSRAGTEVLLQDLTILRVKTPDLLQQIQRSPTLRDLLGEPIGERAFAVPREHVARVRQMLVEIGILLD